MAATAYASLVSLLNTLDQINTHPLVSTFFNKNKNTHLSEMVNFFVDFVENYSDADSREVEDLVNRIADAAHKAEDIIEVLAADRVCGQRGRSSLRNLQMIIRDMKSMKDEVIKVKEETGKNPSVLPDLLPSSSSSLDESTTMVGFDDYVQKLWDELTGDDVARSIISITGMGGIGKTTLARNLFENSNTLRHFNVRVWVTVSQESSAKKVFLQALSCLQGGSIDMDTTDDRQLSDKLHKALFNRRYLIVLDDVWSVAIWDKIKFYFPENNNGSRIVITTRESKLVNYIGSSAIALKFLDEVNSWKLFCEKTFPQQGFPPELEDAGKKIVKKCRGLPLEITVIGGLLGKSLRTQEYWEKIAKDKSLILNRGDNKPSSILYLSYKYLPVCLKSCFLHFGLYPEDFKIEVPTVIKLWIANGLIKANRGQSLEEVAESYFNDLVDRNLLFLHSSSYQSSKSCSTHDLVRDLCIEIGEKENFFRVQRSIDGNYHFIADQTTSRFYSKNYHASSTASILFPLEVPRERTAQFKTRLLRVLCRDGQSPYSNALQEVNMRFLLDNSSTVEHDYLLPSLLHRFWCLQTLIVETRYLFVAPTEIWKMRQLRHINVWNLYIPDPPPRSGDDVYVLENLQTLKTVHNLILTEEVCKRISNIKKLHIEYDFTKRGGRQLCYHVENLVCFNKLESLEYRCERAGDSLKNMKFPSSLKELRLDGCKLEWSYMAVIASLPHLQFLYLNENAIAGTDWVLVDETFCNLKHMIINRCGDVTKWVAESSNFPVLEKLSIWNCPKLSEIPSGIGEIPTLQSIYLSDCSESAYISAVEILHEQQRFENLGLRLIIDISKPEILREKIEKLGLTCQNLKFGRDW